ncbi:MAG: beta-galactosidase [Chloroflexi bacterium OHK40]
MPRSVSVTRDGVLIDGRLIYLLSGCIHYFRYPRAEWERQLELAAWAGLNTIDTVIPWNRHEPSPGAFDFAEEADLGAFLDLCQRFGFYAIVRPGPYICAEWENGGMPAWLTAQPGIQLRVDHPAYLEATLRWFDTLMPVIVPRQLTRGGPVILCQIENEHWASGRYGHDQHQRTLDRAAVERGIEVPQYTCMGAMPGRPEFRNGWSGLPEKLRQTRALWPENPLIISELWSGWFDSWGASRHTHKTAEKLDVTLHQLTAAGCSGFSHWMWAGGTNFGYWGGRTVGGDLIHMTTSYDYHAPVSEYGEPRPKASVARRHHLFLGSLGARLAPVLADAVPGGPRVIGPPVVKGRSDGGGSFQTVQAGAGAPPAWRDFTATYLHNPTAEGITFQLFVRQPSRHLAVEVEPQSIRPVFTNLPLDEDRGLVLRYHTGRILGFWQGDTGDTLVIYGLPGEVGELELAAPGGWEHADEPPTSFSAVEVAGEALWLRYWLAEGSPALMLRAGGRPLTLQLLTTGELDSYDPRGITVPELPAEARPPRTTPLTLVRHGVAELQRDTGWEPIAAPLALERLGCDYGYGWYRAELELDTPLEEQLIAPALSDRAVVLADGAPIGTLGVDPSGPRFVLPLHLGAGRHSLLLLADNLGRFNYGSGLGELKGLTDTLYLGGIQHDLTGGWTALWQEAVFAGEALAHAHPAAVRPDAAEVDLANFAFEGPSVWLLRTFQAHAGRRYQIYLTGDRNPGALFVNGVAVERFSRHKSGGLIRHEITAHVRPGENQLALNIQGYAGLPWRAYLLEYDPARPLPARWSFRAGVTPGVPSASGNGEPAFYRATFGRIAEGRPGHGLRLRIDGASKGQIWLNGHNIGRFWNVGPQEAYKLPLSWQRDENELLIFVEGGRAPTAELRHG